MKHAFPSINYIYLTHTSFNANPLHFDCFMMENTLPTA